MVATACLKNKVNLPVRLMFQDEARFGRMSDPRACWAPAPIRPMVKMALVREFRYEYAAVSPWDGALDYMTLEKMNTENMSRFLNQVHQNHPEDFMIMVLDGASSHRGKELIVPENISLVFMPPYSPELNPAEQIWNRLRKNYFANKVFHSLDAVTQQAEQGLFEMASDKNAVMSLTYWPWIKSIDLTAN
ncbi:MAG: IS630 family transposase [Dehalococcoidia bacterium]|nr:IS630 family transposase [Dehalococcoidia bacterium]